jgi:hypothetical protein
VRRVIHSARGRTGRLSHLRETAGDWRQFVWGQKWEFLNRGISVSDIANSVFLRSQVFSLGLKSDNDSITFLCEKGQLSAS